MCKTVSAFLALSKSLSDHDKSPNCMSPSPDKLHVMQNKICGYHKDSGKFQKLLHLEYIPMAWECIHYKNFLLMRKCKFFLSSFLIFLP